jgi:S1-C subfamily serine protease
VAALTVLLIAAGVAWTDSAFQKAIAKATPCVVTVSAGSRLTAGLAGPVRQPLVASGVILTADGYIVSNASSLGPLQNVKVELKEGKAVDARTVKVDRTMDLVILKVERKDLPALPPYVDAKPRLGQWVIVIGNQFGLSETKSDPMSAGVGVIAAVDPLKAANFDYKEPVIQADVSVNVGAFGGALVDIEGRLIGVTGRLVLDTRTNTPVNFAIPAAAVRKLLDEAMNPRPEPKPEPKPAPEPKPTPAPTPAPETSVKRPGYLGAFILDETDSRTGATIYRVVPGTPAETAGLHEGDLIVAVDKKEVANGRECLRQLDRFASGQSVTITVRRGRDRIDLGVTLEKAPSPVLR